MRLAIWVSSLAAMPIASSHIAYAQCPAVIPHPAANSTIAFPLTTAAAFAAIDVFMCGRANPKHAIAELTRVLAPQHQLVKEASRGRV